jgi:hypothetical protein
LYQLGDVMDVYKETSRYNGLVQGSGRLDIMPINPQKQFRLVVDRARKPGKIERMRDAEGMQ